MSSGGRYYWDDECPLRTKLTDEESRANYNLQMNMTALHYACFFGKSEAVEALCSLGASVIVADDRSHRPRPASLSYSYLPLSRP